MNSRVTLVCGAPGSGKTTYVQENRQAGDLVWDFDVIVQALTGLPMYQKPDEVIALVLGMRNGFFSALQQKRLQSNVWIIGSCPTRRERMAIVDRFKANLVLLDTDEQTCNRRVLARGMPADHVCKWFRHFEPE